MGFDIRQISDSPWATIGLAVDSAMQQSILNSSYYTQTNFPNVDYLLDPKVAFEQTVKRIQANPVMYMPPTVFANYMFPGSNISGDTFTSQFSNLQIPQFPWMQPTKPETPEQKTEREAKEKEDKKQEADDAKDLKAFLDEVKKFADNKDNHVSLPSSVIKKAEDALKKEKAADRLAAMQEIIKGLNPEVVKKVLINNDELKSKLVDAGFKMSKYIDDSKLYSQGTNSTGIPADIRNHTELKSIHDKLKKEGAASGNNASVNYEYFKPFAESLSKDNVLGFISNWNDKYNTDSDRSFLRYIANNLPDNKNTKVAAEKAAVTAYVDGINAVVRALVTKAQTWDGNYPKLDKDIKNLERLQKGLNADNLTQTYVNKIAGAFETLYVRLRMMDAEKITNSITSNRTFKLLKAANPDGINESFVKDETKSDLSSEGIKSVPSEDNLDKIEKSTDEVYIEQQAVDDLDEKYENDAKGLAEALVKNELLKPVKKDGKVAYYKTNSLDNASGQPLAIRYFKVIDNKLVEIKPQKTEDGKTKLMPDKEPVEVSARDIREYNDSISRVKDLVNANKIEPLYNIGKIVPKYPMYKATATDEYFVWRNNQLVKIKNAKSLTGKNSAVHIKIEGAENSVTLEKLMENDDNFESFDDDELKTVEELKAEKEEKAKAEKEKAAQKRIDNIVDPKESYIFSNNEHNVPLDKLKLEETGVFGYFVTKDEPKLFFRYDRNAKKLVHLKDAVKVSKNGMWYNSKGTGFRCQEAYSVAYGVDQLHKLLAKRVLSEDEKAQAKRIINTFRSYGPYEATAFIKQFYGKSTMFSSVKGFSRLVRNNNFSDAEKKDIAKGIALRIKTMASYKKIKLPNGNADLLKIGRIINGENVAVDADNRTPNIASTYYFLDTIIKSNT